MSDKRLGMRWSSCLRGQLRPDSGAPLDCLIRDFSSEGARIELPITTAVPETIDLYFPLKQATYRARVRWRSQNEVGVCFEEAHTATPTDPVQAHLFSKVLRLEAENADLRLEAAQLRIQLEHIGTGEMLVNC